MIERYEVTRALGEGAMAAVYLVRHTTLGTDYALKMLTLSRSRELKERMIQEGRTQAQLEHPNIVRVFDVLTVDGMPALILEYVNGRTLEEILEDGPMPLAEAEEMFRGIVAGVAEAHRAGLVHRDLKPANIMVQPTREGPVPKVADFGLAKAWADQDAVSRTRAGTAMGTPQYMAPEQATNAKDVDHRADLFALGCILFEMVCSRKAFEGDNLPTIFNLILSGDYPAPQEVKPDLPARFRAAIDGCLQIDPADRIADCDALIAVLDGGAHEGSVPAAETLPVEVERTPPPTSLVPEGRRRWMWAAALSVPALAGVGGLALLVLVGALWALWPAGEGGLDPATGEIVDGPCPGPRGTTVGWAWAGNDLSVDEGEVWVVDRDRNVRADFPREENGHNARAEVVCVLRKGTRLRIEGPLERPSRSIWVPVVAGAIED